MDIDPKSILDYFQSDKQIREGQKTILLEAEQKINEGYKNLIIEAPTGVGKSAIAYAIMRYLRSGYAVTSTKSLQEQYYREYPEFFQIKGKGAFTCNYKDEQKIKGNFECGICEGKKGYDDCIHKFASSAPCITEAVFHDEKGKNSCPYHVDNEDYNVYEVESDRGLIQKIVLLSDKKQIMIDERYQNPRVGLDLQKKMSKKVKKQIVNQMEPCHYFDQLAKGMLADHSILNYSNYMIFSHMQRLPHRNVTIFDEAHDIENQVIKFTELVFNINDVKEILYNVGEDPESVQIPDEFDIMRHVPLMEKMQGFLDSIAGIKANNDFEKQLKKKAIETRNHIKRTLDFIALDINNWKVIDLVRDKYTGIINKAVYKPINLSYFCRMLYRNTTYNVFMSATILDRTMYCENQGLDPETTAYISIPSDFPPDNRPIYRMNIAQLNKNTMQEPEVQQKIIDSIDELMTKHKDEKGIIHCTSYKQVDFIMDSIPRENHKRLRRTVQNGDSAKVVQDHKQDPGPTVLISPSLNTGIDLKYDESRFQIIVKVPFPDLSDKWTVAKKQDNIHWFIYKTCLWIVQAYGRSIRAKDDKAVTYILDSNFQKLIMLDPKAVFILPRWFKDAIVRV